MTEKRLSTGVVHANVPAFQKRKNRFKVFRTRIMAIILTLSVALGGFLLYRFNRNDFTPVMPEGYESIYTNYKIKSGDTLTSIAKVYYDADVYSLYYQDLNGYIDAIKKANNIHGDTIYPHQALTIPALMETDNDYTRAIAELEQQIADLPYWVSYKVELGDSILGLAYRATNDTNEAYKIADEIKSKNGLSDSRIYAGQNLIIVNPERGELKQRITELQVELQESLKVGTDAQEDISVQKK